MNLENFLINYLKKLKDRNISYCILRNYEELPYDNVSNDIDILIKPEDRYVAIKELSNIDNIKITECCEHEYLTSLFISGVDWGRNYCAIQLDLFTALNWKGLAYLTVEQVIKEAIPINEAISIIIKPNAPHEAIISLFSSYLVGGWIKQKYQSKVKDIFSNNREEIISILSQVATYKIIVKLVELVCTDSLDELIKLLPELRRSIFFRSFFRNPLSSFKTFSYHYYKEVLIRYTPMHINEVCVLGPDGSGKSSAIFGTKEKLLHTTKILQIKHLKPQIFRATNHRTPVPNPHGTTPRSSFVSVLKIIIWSFEYWIKKVFHGYKDPTLIFWDRYFHDLLIDPYRYRFGAPLIFAKIFSKLVPKPGLMIILHAPPELIQMRKQEVTYKETIRQCKEYLKFAAAYKNAVIIDASSPLESVVDKLAKEIVDFLARKKNKHIECIINKKSNKWNLSTRI